MDLGTRQISDRQSLLYIHFYARGHYDSTDPNDIDVVDFGRFVTGGESDWVRSAIQVSNQHYIILILRWNLH